MKVELQSLDWSGGRRQVCSFTPYARIMLTPSDVVERFSLAISRGDAGLFVGSGLSVPSGAPSWSTLFSAQAADLGIVLRDSDNLPEIAQYVINASMGNRGPLVSEIRDLTAKTSGPNTLHKVLVNCGINTIWTTNYDTLLEEAYGSGTALVRVEDSDIATVRRLDSHVEILKIHGCRVRSNPSGMVITTKDYDELEARRPALVQRLRHDMMNRSFLFLGYSYSDPDIRTVMQQVRLLTNGDTREHFMLTTKEKRSAELERRQELWVDELRRVGIRCALLDSHSELQALLAQMVLLSRGRTIFPTGSHMVNADFAVELGSRLATLDPEVVLLDGQSEGMGRDVLNGFSSAIIRGHKDIRPRIRLYPNPYAYDPALANDTELLETLMSWRSGLLRDCRIFLAFDGGMGTAAEVAAALKLGCTIIPIPLSRTGSAIKLMKNKVIATNLARLAPSYLSGFPTDLPTVEAVVDCVERVLGE